MHSFVCSLHHIVFATKNRERVLDRPIEERLWPYLGGIAREFKGKALGVGGYADHIHVLLSLPGPLSVSKAVQLLKANSSKWVNETYSQRGRFSWQEGYGSFSIGISGVEDTLAYIRNQEEHHRVRTFREEMERILVKHGMQYDPEMLD